MLLRHKHNLRYQKYWKWGIIQSFNWSPFFCHEKNTQFLFQQVTLLKVPLHKNDIYKVVN